MTGRVQLATLAMIAALSACGGSGGGTVTTTPDVTFPVAADPPTTGPASELLQFYLDAELAMETRLDQRSNTAFVDNPATALIEPIEGVPDSGTADYAGYMTLVVEDGGAVLRLYGDAALEADFNANGAFSGSVTDFAGGRDAGTNAAYTGSVALSGGGIGQGVPNDIAMDYSGALTGNGEDVTVSGTLIGKFKGDPIVGLEANDPALTGTIGTAAATGNAQLVAETLP